jgi:TonB family protein
MKDKQSYEHGPITGLTPKLMEGYVNRTLSPQLMRKVKEFLDKNPFEAEAMEGLKSQSVDLSEELQDLEGRLSRKLSVKNNQFRFSWPVAAAVSLLAVSGVLFYFLMPGQADKVALNQESTEVKTEQLKAVPETTLADDVTPAPSSEIKVETEIVAVPDNEEIEEPKLQSSQTAALPIDNLIEEQESTVQEGVVADDSHRQPAPPQSSLSAREEPQATARSKAKKNAVSAVSEPTTSIYLESAELPMAEAPAGINEYLKKHTHYPKTAKTEGIQGSVIVTFIVNEKGGLEDFEIVRELGYGCDEEAVKTLRQGPSWKPAEINGIPVKSRGQIEVEFPPQK